MATPMYGPFGLGLEYWTYKRLLREVLVDIDTTIQWCKRNGLLARSQECNACSIPMHWEVYDRGIDGYRWRCPNKCCRKVKSIRHDSWFSQSHLTLEQILEVTFLWTEDMSGETVCAVYMDQIETEKIGGVGKVVEIDESKFGKRKYNRGRRREGQWVLGGVERGSEEMFMQIVPSRDAATLLPVIIANVKPGTEIHTDEWRSYARLNRRGYVHHTENAPERATRPKRRRPLYATATRPIPKRKRPLYATATRPIPKRRPLYATATIKADPEKKKASVRDSYNADIESKQSAKRQRYQEDVEENRAAKRRTIQLPLRHLKGIGIGMTPLSDWLNVLPRGSGIAGVTEQHYHPKGHSIPNEQEL
eukprot:Em0004g296a